MEIVYILLILAALGASFFVVWRMLKKRKPSVRSDRDLHVCAGGANNERDHSQRTQELALDSSLEGGFASQGAEAEPTGRKQNYLPENAIAISAIQSFVLKDSQGRELTLTKADTKQLGERQYREICVRGSSAIGQAAQGAMPILAQAKTMSEIAKAAPSGLFTATGSVQDLMKYTDGTISSIVTKNGKVVAHTGFADVDVSVSNSAAVVGASMQAMAMISGQYYMHKIAKQLKSVDQKLGQLIGYHHDEKIGILKQVNRDLCILAAKVNVDAADIISCQRIAEKCSEVYYEYHTRLEGMSIDTKERWLNKPKELRELGKSITESELDFSIQMCYTASELYEKCKLTG